MNNLLIHGENIQGLNYLMEKRSLRGKIDLVYIDPPFATGSDFVVSDDRVSTISSSRSGDIAYSDKVTGMEFVEEIRKRCILLKELLSDRGSIYLHTDYKIGHYLKVMMDEVFGIKNFRNDITRIKCNPKNFDRVGYGNMKDLILFYSKTASPIWNEPRWEYSEKDMEKLFPKIDKNGRRYTTVPIHAPGESANPQSFKGIMPPKGRHWRTDVAQLEELDRNGLIEWSAKGNPRKINYADEGSGKRVQDVWLDYKDPQYPTYPTEKNQDFIDMIVQTSSNEDSIVLDCYCGSGTTLKSASDNGRSWIGIDQSAMAIKATKEKLGQQQTLFSSEYEYVEL
ncbi:MAG: site-specific DNA-methyltransferase [Bacteroidales bacterium]|nr:site-specific DNA-methyltransferase [Bacteroidales bacterium]